MVVGDWLQQHLVQRLQLELVVVDPPVQVGEKARGLGDGGGGGR
jgi:hypothetical protein